MRVAVGSDHAGYEEPAPLYKPAIMNHLEAHGHEVVDCGTSGPEAVDYPDFAQRVCETVLEGRAECGVLVCGAGIGMSIAANRHKGIRAAVCVTADMARLGRDHNNANILCLGRRVLSLEECLTLVDVFLEHDLQLGALQGSLSHPPNHVFHNAGVDVVLHTWSTARYPYRYQEPGDDWYARIKEDEQKYAQAGFATVPVFYAAGLLEGFQEELRRHGVQEYGLFFAGKDSGVPGAQTREDYWDWGLPQWDPYLRDYN